MRQISNGVTLGLTLLAALSCVFAAVAVTATVTSCAAVRATIA